jgi:hypothetical protein
MKKLEFIHHNKTNAILLLVFYIVFLLAIAVFVGSGAWGILDFINSFRSGKIPGLLGGLIFLSPLIWLVKLTKTKYIIEIYPQEILFIHKKRIQKIPTEDITKIVLNDPVSSFNLLNDKDLMISLNSADGEEALHELCNAILEEKEYTKDERYIKFKKTQLLVNEYIIN